MKKIYLLIVLIGIGYFSDAQLVPCRPRVAMIYYWGHDDSAPNTAMSTIISFKPDILIDNTSGGLWHGGTIPSLYAPYGIAVYSYITGGYEHHTRGGDTSDLAANLLRVDAIAADNSVGVYLDEVSSFPDSTRMAYIASIYTRCQSKGLKLIINPGVSNFDTALMSHCDYILTDEHYNQRQPTDAELQFIDRVIVVSLGVTNPTDAANNSLRARDFGFGHSYSCYEYINFPAWLQTYNTYISNMTPATPNIQESGPYIISTSLVGNQWYDAVGMLVGETSYVLTPLASGDYYSIVTLDNCVSDTSNVVTFDVNATGIENTGNNKDIVLYPVPAVDNVLVKISGNANNETTIKIYNMVGVLVKTEYLSNAPINVSSLPSGIYVMSLQSTNFIANKALIIQR